MSRLRILNAEALNYSDKARAILRDIGDLTEAQLERSDLIRALPEYDVLITRLANRIDASVMETGKRLRAIVTATTGLDHIDLDEAKRRGIAVLSLRGETEFLESVTATAEHTWALLLALVRKVAPAFDHVRRGDWQRDNFVGRTLSGRTLGVVGYGRLGRMVARYGQAFGMNVIVNDIAPDRLGAGIRSCNLDELIATSDVVSLHVPLNDTTRGMFGKNEFAQCKSGSVLVNTSRGEIVDGAALIAALDSRRLSGAALDVVADEKPGEGTMREHPLLRYAGTHDNLLITPHIGGATEDSMHQTEVFMAEKLRRWAQGEKR